MLNRIKNKIILAAVVIMIANPLLAYAQAAGGTIIQPQDASIQAGANDLPDYSQSGVENSIKEYLCTPSDTPTGNDLANCINKLYRFGIAFGSIALVFFLVLAGYLYITGGESGKQKAKAVITNALVGMAILLSSFLLLGFINPDLTVFKPINPPVFIDPGIPQVCKDLGYEADCGVNAGDGEQDGGGAPGGGNEPVTESAKNLAAMILARTDITPIGGSFDRAKENLVATAAGNKATLRNRSTVALSPLLLTRILGLADAMNFKFTINWIAGATHSSNSYHYVGRGADFGPANRDQLLQIKRWCQQSGAREALGPGDKDHNDHAHCAW